MSNRRISIGEREFNELLGANLKHFRKSKKLTQTDIAEAIDVSFQAVQKYEKGACSPSPFSLHKMAVFLNIRLDDLLDPRFQDRLKKYKDDMEILEYEKTTITGTAILKPKKKEAEEWL